MKIEIDDKVMAELEYMHRMLLKDGRNEFEDVASIVRYVLASIADGSRRPGSWERQMLEMMGLVSEQQGHQIYRIEYGEPKEV